MKSVFPLALEKAFILEHFIFPAFWLFPLPALCLTSDYLRFFVHHIINWEFFYYYTTTLPGLLSRSQAKPWTTPISWFPSICNCNHRNFIHLSCPSFIHHLCWVIVGFDVWWGRFMPGRGTCIHVHLERLSMSSILLSTAGPVNLFSCTQPCFC